MECLAQRVAWPSDRATERSNGSSAYKENVSERGRQALLAQTQRTQGTREGSPFKSALELEKTKKNWQKTEKSSFL